MPTLKIDWTHFDALLGKLSDAEVAKEICRVMGDPAAVSKMGVWRRRQKLKKKPAKRKDWKPGTKDKAQLGTMSDTAIAELAGVTPGVVRRYRQKQGIQAFQPHAAKGARPYDDRLGTVPDPQLAREFDVSSDIIRRRREKLGIKPFAGANWVGRDPDTHCKVDWAKYDKLFGTMTDKALMQQVNQDLADGGSTTRIGLSAVTYQRSLRGIKACKTPAYLGD